MSSHSLVVPFAGLGLVLLPAVFARRLLRTKKLGRPLEVNSFDRRAIGLHSQWAEWLGNLGTALGIASPFAVDWRDTRGKRSAFLDDAVVICQALALNGALNTAVKYTVQRPLPETYAGVVPHRRGEPRGYRAFYSGHVSSLATALSAACITVRMRHGHLPWRWPWIFSAALTGLVGVARVFSGKHFPSDVLVAAPAGTAIGVVVPLLHAQAGALRRASAKRQGIRRWRAVARRTL